MTDTEAWRKEALRRLLAGRSQPGGVSRVVMCLRRDDDEELPVSIQLNADANGLTFSAPEPLSTQDETAALRGWLGSSYQGAEGASAANMVEGEAGVPEAGDAEKRREFGEALRDVVLVVTRLGARRAPDSPSLNTALTRVLEIAPQPTSLGLARWIGRLARALDRGDPGVTASVLLGAELAGAALLGEGDEHSAERQLVWAPSLVSPRERRGERCESQTMLELGREWAMGLRRRSVERRYLLNLDTGEILREQRRRGEPSPSAGPCPREIDVDLARISPGVPRGVHLLQYRVRMGMSSRAFEAAERASVRDFEKMPAVYLGAARRWPALGEPVVLLAPKVIGKRALFDESGARLPLSPRAQGAVGELLASAAKNGPIAWLLARLVTRQGKLCIAPLSVGSRGETENRLIRLA